MGNAPAWAEGEEIVHENPDAFLNAAIEGVLGMARSEILTLTVASQRNDGEGVARAAGRIRYAIEYARRLGQRSVADLERNNERFHSVLTAATTRLPLSLERERNILWQAWSEGRLGKVLADDCALVGLDLDDLPLTGLSVCRSKLSQVSARNAQLDTIAATDGHISDSRFTRANLRGGKFDGVTLERCDFSNANLDGSTWHRAVARNCKFNGAFFFSADLRNAHFVACDFKDADLQGYPESVAEGATFVCCDLRRSGWYQRNLRDVSFVECKLYGVWGDIAGGQLATFERACISPDGDGSQVVSKETVLQRWAANP